MGLILTVALVGHSLSFCPDNPADALRERGFRIVADEVGTTGLCCSYHGRSLDDEVYRSLPQFTEETLRYGGDGRPAPGGRQGLAYDEGVLAYKVEGGDLVLAVASPLDPRQWHASSHGNLVGQGDLFVTVDQGRVHQFALMNDIQGGDDVGHDGYFEPAQRFRYAAEGSRVGSLVELTAEEDVLLSGGDQGHVRDGNSPDGLDERVFAQGGRVVDEGSVRHYELTCSGQQRVRWVVSEWRLPLHALGDAHQPMTLALHVAPSCGNDQIGGTVPLGSHEIN